MNRMLVFGAQQKLFEVFFATMRTFFSKNMSAGEKNPILIAQFLDKKNRFVESCKVDQTSISSVFDVSPSIDYFAILMVMRNI